MPITLLHEEGNTYRVEILGTLRSRDLRHCEDALAAAMSHVGAVRLLIRLDGFEGWDPVDDWRDLSFYVRKGDAVERIAIVGEERWRGPALMFAGADLRKSPVEFFTAEHPARTWLSRVAPAEGP